MTTPDKLSRERLEELTRDNAARHMHRTLYADLDEENSMATEILELREEVERLRRSQMHVRSIAPWPPVEVSSITPGADGQIPQIPDPVVEGLRARVDAIEAGLAYVRGRLNI